MWVKGDSVALGYFQDRDKSWATFLGHWCRTGDLFRIDEDGYLWFSGRADDLLKVGGIWVAPARGRGVPDAARRRCRSPRSSAPRKRAS